MSEVDSELDKPLIIFGRDVRKIPCFRSSILYGVGFGIGGGLVTFMLTSKPRLGSHAGFGTFVFVTMTYWFSCRLKRAEENFNAAQIRMAYQKMLVLRGTEEDPEMRKKVEVADV